MPLKPHTLGISPDGRHSGAEEWSDVAAPIEIQMEELMETESIC